MAQLTEMTQLLLLLPVVVVVGLQLVLQVQLLLLLLARGCEARVAGSRRVQDPSNWATAAARTGQLWVHMPELLLLLLLLQNCKLVVLLLLLLCWPLGAPVSLPRLLLLLVAAAEPLVLVVDVLCWTLLPACCCRRELSCSHTCAGPCYVTHAYTHSPLLLVLVVVVVVVPLLLVLLVLLVQAGVTEDLSYCRAVSCGTRSTHCRGRQHYSYPYPCTSSC
jgi:hypothetical protein